MKIQKECAESSTKSTDGAATLTRTTDNGNDGWGDPVEAWGDPVDVSKPKRSIDVNVPKM